ncbi:MAG: Xaa-Pro peptidase family protein [Acetobacteraceae bacterium]|nr:Xaa-Pro peptidase family protein [Acetobacteraceae bacterium]
MEGTSEAGRRRTFEARYDRLREALAEAGLDAVVASPSDNLYYLTGFRSEPDERVLLGFFPLERPAALLVPALYEEQVRASGWKGRMAVWPEAEGPKPALCGLIEELGLSGAALAVDDEMRADYLLTLMEAARPARMTPASAVLGQLRVRKSPEEVELLRRAAALADQALEAGIRACRAGSTEREVALALELAMRQAGAGGLSFPPIVQSGPNGAMPHQPPGDRRLAPGDAVVLDFGCRVEGYCSDITRTLCVKQPEPELERVHRIVEEAQRLALSTVAPGRRAGEVDAAARRHIEERGYGAAFIHRTGHGIGLSGHEAPYIAPGDDTILEPGMVFSIEPGIYLPGRFGVRLEDIVVVTASGAERLNQAPRALIRCGG